MLTDEGSALGADVRHHFYSKRKASYLGFFGMMFCGSECQGPFIIIPNVLRLDLMDRQLLVDDCSGVAITSLFSPYRALRHCVKACVRFSFLGTFSTLIYIGVISVLFQS